MTRFCILAVAFSGLGVFAQTLNNFRLDQYAERFTGYYGTPVTYEDPLWLWRGVMRPLLLLPQELDVKVPGTLDISRVERALAAFNNQNPSAPHYRVVASKWGLHVIPFEAHDAEGKLAPAQSILDARIRIPRQDRMASEHIAELCTAVMRATGMIVKINDSDWFDRAFAANGYYLPQLPTANDWPHMRFEWGTPETSARDALIDILRRSCTTMAWHLMCGADAPPTQRFCVINFLPLTPSQMFDRWAACDPHHSK